jgi:hypothetical protein
MVARPVDLQRPPVGRDFPIPALRRKLLSACRSAAPWAMAAASRPLDHLREKVALQE